MSSINEHKILKNMPYYNAYGQYYYNEDDNLDFLDSSGIKTTFTTDDLYTIITEEGFHGGGDDTNMPDWRPLSNVLIGNPTDLENQNNIFIQRYYEFGTNNYIRTSAPNVVSLVFQLAENNNAFDLTPINNPYPYTDGSEITGNIGVRILNWDWKPGEYEFPPDFETNNPLDENYVNLFDSTGQNYLTHQYDSSGLKIIKASVFAIDSLNRIRYKHLEIRLFLGLDGVFVEDFIDIGGPDFTYLPWPQTSPIIGGISKESNYYKSVESIVNSNPFADDEKFEKYFAEKAFNNNELGESLGDTDIEQVRAFKGGIFDMNYLLGIGNELLLEGFNPYYDTTYWDGEITGNQYPKETYTGMSVGILFIDESEDQLLIDNCLFEFNCGDVNVSNMIDTSGGGNKGILIGDYKINKEEKGIKSRRDTIIKLPKTDNKNGAI